ncbi:hypothetical protein TNCV_3630071 [Trichonephila clavipes]|nr:hypothetical protein TNCV_3630071 [Trichonephila clavipes]
MNIALQTRTNFLCDDERDLAVHRRQSLRTMCKSLMEGIDSIQHKYHIFSKQKDNHCSPFLLGADGQLNCHVERLLHPHNFEGRRMARGTEVLPTTPHSGLDICAVAKPWKEKIAKVPLHFDLLSYKSTF